MHLNYKTWLCNIKLFASTYYVSFKNCSNFTYISLQTLFYFCLIPTNIDKFLICCFAIVARRVRKQELYKREPYTHLVSSFYYEKVKEC